MSTAGEKIFEEQLWRRVRKAIKACGARHATAEVEAVCGAAARHAPQATKWSVLCGCGGAFWFLFSPSHRRSHTKHAFCIIEFLVRSWCFLPHTLFLY